MKQEIGGLGPLSNDLLHPEPRRFSGGICSKDWRTYSDWGATFVTRKGGELHLYVQAATFNVSHVLRLAGTISALRRSVRCPAVHEQLRYARTLHTQSSSVRFRYKPSRLLGLSNQVEELGLLGKRSGHITERA